MSCITPSESQTETTFKKTHVNVSVIFQKNDISNNSMRFNYYDVPKINSFEPKNIFKTHDYNIT